MDHVVKVDEMKRERERERERERQSVEVENREQQRNCRRVVVERYHYLLSKAEHDNSITQQVDSIHLVHNYPTSGLGPFKKLLPTNRTHHAESQIKIGGQKIGLIKHIILVVFGQEDGKVKIITLGLL